MIPADARRPQSVLRAGAAVVLSASLFLSFPQAAAQERPSPRPQPRAAAHPDELAALTAERRGIASPSPAELVAISGALSARADRASWLLAEIDDACPAEKLATPVLLRERLTWLAAWNDALAAGGSVLDAAGGEELRKSAAGRASALGGLNTLKPALRVPALTVDGRALSDAPFQMTAGAEPLRVRLEPGWADADVSIPPETAQLSFTLTATGPGGTAAASAADQRDAASLEPIDLLLAIPEQAGEYALSLTVVASKGPSAEAWWPLDIQLPSAVSGRVIRPMAAPPPPPPNALAAQVSRDIAGPGSSRGAQLARLIGRRDRAEQDKNAAVAQWLDWYLGVRADRAEVPELAAITEPWVAYSEPQLIDFQQPPLALLQAIQARKARAAGVVAAGASTIELLPGNLPNENRATTVTSSGGGQIVSASYDAVIELVKDGDRVWGVILARAQTGSGYDLLSFDGAPALLQRLRERNARTGVICVDAGVGTELLLEIRRQFTSAQLAASLSAMGTLSGAAWKADGQFPARLAIFRAAPDQCKSIAGAQASFGSESFPLLVE
ncbi:MAG: hypothetical protein IPM64_15585 [Phycisphaerales bacterium]|nr:hypothetical protein [Phycisphaerales bacterium]